MDWVRDVTVGDWIAERLDDAWNIHRLVPRGFEAYARILHPAVRERPVDAAWPPEGDERAWAAFAEPGYEVDAEHVTWEGAARALGATFDPLGSWADSVGGDPATKPRDADGWRYDVPEEGFLEPGHLAVVAEHLAAHTACGDEVYVGVWEGWGGLVGFLGHTPSRAALVGDVAGAPARHRNALDRSIRDPFNSVFRRRTWQQGILSDEISKGPRLQLADREHVLFRGRIGEFERDDWTSTAPWADPRDAWVHSPSVLWPADRMWYVATDVDLDSTLVGGSAELIRTLSADERVEAHPIREGTVL